MDKLIISQCYQKSIEVLKNNSSDFGILASANQKAARERNYLSVFSRDASICLLGIVASQNRELLLVAKKSLEILAKCQADNGQIPNYVKPVDGYVDFWRLGCIDATLWWLLALQSYDKYSQDKKLIKKLNPQIKKALNWLSCQQHIPDGLVMQNEASDWADLMPRSGKVVYTNSLWCQVARLYKVKKYQAIKKNFNNLFYPWDAKMRDIAARSRSTVSAIISKEKPKDYYISFINYLFWGHDIDVLGNSLAIIFGLPNKKLEQKIIRNFLKQRSTDLPLPVLFNTIKRGDKYWREYMLSHGQNKPGCYHNGGVWPFASCFWAMALARVGRKREAWQELEKIARANERNNWSFNEWFDSKTGRARGMRYQSWNAGMFLAAYHYLEGNFKF